MARVADAQWEQEAAAVASLKAVAACDARRWPRRTEVEELRKLSADEVHERVVDLKGELFLLSAAKTTRQEFKASDFRAKRKTIARMLTLKREKEIEDGVSARASRKLDRAWKASIVPRPPASYDPDAAKKKK
eukprot:SM000029S10506  [mRNA]  locus=s29:544038:546688:+ [translate_table: standard]